MKEVREFAANTVTCQYHLNLHVIGLNYSSTFVEMIKGYRSMARRFQLDNNYGFETTEMMTMINTTEEKFNINCVKIMQLGKKNVTKQQKM